MSPDEFNEWLARAKTVPGAGPPFSPICLVGEAPGVNEEIYRRPFVGEAGEELTRMLKDAGLDRKSMYATNVFKFRPPDTDRARNDIKAFFVGRADPDAETTLPAYEPGKFVRRQLANHPRELIRELTLVGANVVIALGNTALWALLGHTKISKYLGTVHPPTESRPFTVIPTYHPSAILRQWNFRSIAVANLRKAATVAGRNGSANQHAAPRFKVKTNPTIDEVEAFAAKAVRAPVIAIDVETKHGQIRTIGFAIDTKSAFVIPFWEPPAPPYWSSVGAELRAWNAVKAICACDATKVGHNVLYDIQYLWRVHGIPLRGPIEDTIAWAHASQPELPRSLGHLAATFLNIPEWKTMRAKSEKDEE